MNILFCYQKPIERQYGGVAAVSHTLMMVFNKHGHTCYAISAKHFEGSFSDNQLFLPKTNTPDDEVENQSWFRKVVKEKKISIIINQNALEPSSPDWALRWSAGMPVKKLTVYHNSPYSMFSCNKSNIIDNRLVKLFHLEPIFNWVWRRAFKTKYGEKFYNNIELSDKVIMLSNNYFQELAWFSSHKVDEHFVSIPNPASERFDVSLTEQNKMKEVLFVGRLASQKRVDYLLEIWSKVVSSHTDWHLNIVGDGPLREQLNNLIVNKRIANVSLLGYKDPLDYYKRASIFCMTSRFEGFPGVLVEAMSCGCVPIVFNTYACTTDIIDNEKCGYLVKPYDIDNYTQLLIRLMDDTELRQRFSISAKEKTSLFSINAVMAQWETLFKQ